MPSHPTPVLRIALPVPLPRAFDYRPPAGMAADAGWIGCRVRVPFGPRELVGLVVEQGSAEPASSLRQALAWLDPAPLLQGELWQSLQWLARYTHAPLGEVLSTALPGPLRHGETLPDTHHWGWQLTAAGHEHAADDVGAVSGRGADELVGAHRAAAAGAVRARHRSGRAFGRATHRWRLLGHRPGRAGR